MTAAPDRGNHPDSSQEDLASLLESMDQERATGGQAPGTKGPKSRSPIWYVLLALALVANAYVWIAQPAWIMGGGETPAGMTEEEGILRYRLYVQAQRIHAYEQEHGTLPDRVEQTGVPFTGVRYERTGPSSWQLVGELDGARLTVSSDQSMAEFLGVDGPGSQP